MSYIVYKNKNSRPNIDVRYMLNLGASTERGLTGQGMGVKYAGILGVANGLRFARSSHDTRGAYIAEYKSKPVQLDDGSTHEQAYLQVTREDGVEDMDMTVFVHMVKSAWGKLDLGDDYPLVREPVLDAADEDPGFVVEECDEICFAPPGETWTFVTKNEQTAQIVRYFTYYFHQEDDITWLSEDVGIAEVSSQGETRFFITAEDAPLAYVAWTNFSEGQPSPEPAFDYIFREHSGQKYASLPKRIIENPNDCSSAIVAGMKRCRDADVLETFFRAVLSKGFESTLYLNQYGWYEKEAIRDAVSRIANNRPIWTRRDFLYLEARRRGYNPYIIDNEHLFDIASRAGYQTVAEVLDIVKEGGARMVPMTKKQKQTYSMAMRLVKEKVPHYNWPSHTIMALEISPIDRENKRITLGLHNPHCEAGDVIAINFTDHDSVEDVAETIIHEYAHHHAIHLNLMPDYESDMHGYEFAKAMQKMLTPPFD